MQCKNGHIYDETKNASCPYCRTSAAGIPLGGGAVLPQGIPVAGSAFPKTEASGSGAPMFPKTEPVAPPPPRAGNSSAAMSKTVALDETPGAGKAASIRPVTGWLVVVEGERKGISFNIHGEMNYIGRGDKFDINLAFDGSVSGDGDCSISFDDREGVFSVAPFHNKNIIRLNGKVLLSPMELKEYDCLEIGTTKLRFRSFCNDSFNY